MESMAKCSHPNLRDSITKGFCDFHSPLVYSTAFQLQVFKGQPASWANTTHLKLQKRRKKRKE